MLAFVPGIDAVILSSCWPLCLPSCCFVVLLASVPAFLLFCRSAGLCACLPAVLLFCWPLCLPSCCFAVLLASVPAFLPFCWLIGFCVVLHASWSTGRQPLDFSLCLPVPGVLFSGGYIASVPLICAASTFYAFMFLVAQLSVLVVHVDILLVSDVRYCFFCCCS